MKKFFNWLIDKWLAGFITACTFFLLKLYIDLPDESKKHFFSFHWLSEIFEIKLSLTTVLIIVSIIVLITRIEKWILKAKTKNSDYSFLNAPQNHYENYTADTFGVNKTKWTWNYRWEAYDQKFIIINLKPCCPTCGTPMEFSQSNNHNATCHKCRLEGRYYYFELKEYLADVEREVIRKIHNNEVKIA